jgi:hypothetical protein
LRELLTEGQGHQETPQIDPPLPDRSTPGREVVVTHRDRLKHGGDERARGRLLLLRLVGDRGQEGGTRLLFPEGPLTFGSGDSGVVIESGYSPVSKQ